ncbi:MAG: hypothetical protein OT477_12885 [Chloroflexi bacterium]|nr:hypothetical protein [Chloroflexota bacterium]
MGRIPRIEAQALRTAVPAHGCPDTFSPPQPVPASFVCGAPTRLGI